MHYKKRQFIESLVKRFELYKTISEPEIKRAIVISIRHEFLSIEKQIAEEKPKTCIIDYDSLMASPDPAITLPSLTKEKLEELQAKMREISNNKIKTSDFLGLSEYEPLKTSFKNEILSFPINIWNNLNNK